jgi:hypothetical protein
MGYSSFARESRRCLAGVKALLGARRNRHHCRGAECDLLLLHSDHPPADGHRGLGRSGGQCNLIAMAASGLRSSCSHPGGVAGSTKGIVVARSAWQLRLEMLFLVRRTSENSVMAKFAEIVKSEVELRRISIPVTVWILPIASDTRSQDSAERGKRAPFWALRVTKKRAIRPLQPLSRQSLQALR